MEDAEELISWFDITMLSEYRETFGNWNSEAFEFLPQRLRKALKERARGAYIASICQPEASFDVASAAQSIDPSKVDIERLNERLRWQQQNGHRGLRYIQLHLSKMKLYVFVDALFANNRDYSS